MNRKVIILAMMGVVMAVGSMRAAFAADVDADIKTVMARIEARNPELAKLRDAGTVGETANGLVEAVKTADEATAKVVTAENADREELFKLMAQKQSTSVEKVRLNFAVFRLKNAEAKHYFKGKNGEWLTREDWEKKVKDGGSGPLAG